MYELQLQWIRCLQEILRSPWLDGFFKIWNNVDSGYFAIVMVSLVWYLWDRRIGIRFFYILAISLILNKFLKALFHQPRPCQLDPLVGILCSHSPGLPSGGAQMAALYFGLVYLECKKSLYRWLTFVFALFLCFSRVYLGFHFPTDILGGIIVGVLLLFVYQKFFPLFQRFWKIAAILFPFVFLLGAWFFSNWTSWDFYLFFSTLGVAAGLFTYEKKHVQRIGLLQTFVVVAGLFLLFAANQFLPKLEFLWEFGEGYWLSFLGGWVGQKINAFHD